VPLETTLDSVDSNSAGDSRRKRHGVAIENAPDGRSRAYEEAFATGYEAGFASGAADAREFESARLNQFGDELRAVVQRIEAAMELWYLRAEEGLSGVAQAVACRIVGEEIELRGSVVLAIVRDALSRADRAPKAFVRVNPLDLPLIEENQPAVVSAARAIPEIQFVGDDSLPRGSVIIETESGVVDATAATKANRLLSEDAA
jgi:flagellar assembly protein FliH